MPFVNAGIAEQFLTNWHVDRSSALLGWLTFSYDFRCYSPDRPGSSASGADKSPRCSLAFLDLILALAFFCLIRGNSLRRAGAGGFVDVDGRGGGLPNSFTFSFFFE
jgi:hypothetical protein